MHLVDFLGALTHQRFPQTVQNRKRLLGLGLRRNKAHRWSRRGFTDRFSIDEIVFVALHERFNKLQGKQLDLMIHGCQLALRLQQWRSTLDDHDFRIRLGYQTFTYRVLTDQGSQHIFLNRLADHSAPRD